jgi:hypothetical protein
MPRKKIIEQLQRRDILTKGNTELLRHYLYQVTYRFFTAKKKEKYNMELEEELKRQAEEETQEKEPEPELKRSAEQEEQELQRPLKRRSVTFNEVAEVVAIPSLKKKGGK